MPRGDGVVYPPAPMITTLTRNLDSGWLLSMHLVPLPEGLMVYSPTRVGAAVWTRVEAAGKPTVIVAPNHFHHLSLTHFREKYPEALAVCSDGARTRLEAKGHKGIASLDAAAARLGPSVSLLPCPGLKTGETWVSVKDDTGTTLLVCDAFFNAPGPLSGVMGLVLRATLTAPGLRVGRTFRWLAVADRARYAARVDGTLDAVRPTRVLFSHGAPLEGADVSAQLRAAMREGLGL